MSKPNTKQRSQSAKKMTARQKSPASAKSDKRVISRHQPKPAKASRSSRSDTKHSRILAMLRASEGATIAAMMTATDWQPHLVRGFLAGVVRKRLKLNLTSTPGDNGRVYRVKERRPQARSAPLTTT